MAKTVEEKRTYSREYLREKRKDPEWLKANNEKRRNDPELKEYMRLNQESRRRRSGVKSLDSIRALNELNFFIQAPQVHNDKYDYSQVLYSKGSEAVVIICLQHGKFVQTPAAHLRGQGCPQCASVIRASRSEASRLKAAAEFNTKANVIHNGCYDYSLSVYKTVHTKLEIICQDHGAFWQAPAAHLQGQGCPHCANDRRAAFAESRGEQAIAQWLDAHSVPYEKQKMFDECADKLPLRFDFYLPTLNLVIEFDGQQHFEFVKKFHGTQDGFERCKRRDAIKNEYAHRHKIDMLRIKYSEEKQIEKILTKRILDELQVGELL